VKRSLAAPLLACALVLPLAGCGVVKGAAERAAAALGTSGTGDAPADAPKKESQGEGLSIAADAKVIDDAAPVREDDDGKGIYKIVEPSGTIRFTSNLSEVPLDQRPSAERLAMVPSRPNAAAPRAPAQRHETRQLAAADAPPQPPAERAQSGGAGGHEVELYTTSWCEGCKKTRSWLDGKRVRYTDHDVESDAAAAAKVRELTGGDSTVPVVVIDGEVIQGFDQERMKSLLQI
jgi:glutaredoxin 3